MPVTAEGKSMMTVAIDQKVHDRIRKIAKRRGVTVNYLVNQALWAMVADDLISIVLLGGSKNADRFSRLVCRVVGDEEGVTLKEDDEEKIRLYFQTARSS